jgi:CelD/BcsL family acetyltransferase involved in cellulose biosynthesis
VVEITLTPLADVPGLEARWRELESVAGAGPFLTWHFIARLVARFDAPHVLAAHDAGRDLALAVFNRPGARLYLHESGNTALDGIFIEHNGLLCRPPSENVLVPALRRLAAAAPVVMSGVNDAHWRAAAAAGLVVGHQARFAPSLELSGLTGPFLAGLSANARAQIRRAMRLYGADLAISRATDGAAAVDYFDEMVGLHQAAWRARGKPGAFADPAIRAFHAHLLHASVPRGEADMLRVTAAGCTVGLLYQLRQAGHVCCYQSGFAPETDARLKPGLVCHSLAIDLYRASGARVYDFLAGADRYKLTLARGGGETLHWFTLYPPGSWAGRARKIAEAASALLRPSPRLP